jgi:CheY-like chemotaxis protein
MPRGLRVLGDPVRLAQVLSNLLTNAAKYTMPGGRIEVVGRREGDRIVVVVRDDGVGIDPELLPHVFELFVQGGQSLDRAKGGLGLGLAIVRNIVELHGGRVFAESAGAGQGSEFRVALPALEGTPADETGPGPLAPSAGTGRRKVLLVDDNEDALVLLGEALTLAGYDVRTASDPITALERAGEVKPMAAVLDIGLPVMDGYELARRLRATPGLEDLKLVALTGYGQPGDRARAREAGFDEHLVKPVVVDELERVLERLVPAAG